MNHTKCVVRTRSYLKLLKIHHYHTQQIHLVYIIRTQQEHTIFMDLCMIKYISRMISCIYWIIKFTIVKHTLNRNKSADVFSLYSRVYEILSCVKNNNCHYWIRDQNYNATGMVTLSLRKLNFTFCNTCVKCVKS